MPTWQEFYDLIYVIRPEASEMLPASSATSRAWVIRSYGYKRKPIQKSVVNSRSRIDFTMDLWTSPTHLGLLGIVTDYTDREGRLNKALLCLSEKEGVHSGENQCRRFVEVIVEYGIQHKLGYVMMDNASRASNDIFMKHVEINQGNARYVLNAQEPRLRYEPLTSNWFSHSSSFF